MRYLSCAPSQLLINCLGTCNHNKLCPKNGDIMEKYTHKIHYYETDRMGVTHHSNYIRIMEEARVDFLDNIGWGYAKLEAMGIMSPVLGIHGQYKESTTFDDVVEVTAKVTEFKGIKFAIEYEMINIDNGHTVFTGRSEHCFLDKDMKPLRLSKEFPEFYEAMCALVEK